MQERHKDAIRGVGETVKGGGCSGGSAKAYAKAMVGVTPPLDRCPAKGCPKQEVNKNVYLEPLSGQPPCVSHVFVYAAFQRFANAP